MSTNVGHTLYARVSLFDYRIFGVTSSPYCHRDDSRSLDRKTIARTILDDATQPRRPFGKNEIFTIRPRRKYVERKQTGVYNDAGKRAGDRRCRYYFVVTTKTTYRVFSLRAPETVFSILVTSNAFPSSAHPSFLNRTRIRKQTRFGFLASTSYRT